MVSDLVLIPVAFLAFGVASLYTGWKRRAVYDLLTDVAPTPVRALASPGVVEVEGAERPAADPLSAPVTGQDAVVAAWRVEEWDERGDTARWREVARGVEATAFDVDDGTGAVAVAPVSERDTAGKWTQTAGVSATTGVRVGDVLAEFESVPVEAELAPDETPPKRIEQLHDDHGLYEDTGSVTNAVDVGKKHGRRRYAEQVVAPGETAYVLGRVRARGDGGRARFRPSDAVVTPPADGLFVLSDQTERRLEERVGTAARDQFALGGVLLLLGSLAGIALLWPL